jgi:hypothetical protein
MAAIYAALAQEEKRNGMIVDDVLSFSKRGVGRSF